MAAWPVTPIDDSTVTRLGPSWKGLFGSPRTYAKGVLRATADEAYLRESILDPAAKVVDRLRARRVGDAELRGRAQRSPGRIGDSVHSDPEIGPGRAIGAATSSFWIQPGWEWRRMHLFGSRWQRRLCRSIPTRSLDCRRRRESKSRISTPGSFSPSGKPGNWTGARPSAAWSRAAGYRRGRRAQTSAAAAPPAARLVP